MDLLVCLRSLSCCITQVHLSLRINWWPHILLQDFLIECRIHGSINYGKSSIPWSPRPSHYHPHVWLLVWCSFYEMLCWFYTRCNGTLTFQKVKLLSHQSTEYLGYLGIIKIFFGTCETSLCVVFGQHGFCLGALLWSVFAVSFLLMNHEHWP